MHNTIKKIKLYDDDIGCVEYVDHMGTDLTIVNAARVSFGKHKQIFDEKDEKLIKYLIKHRHTSTLEHNNVTLRFTVPLFIRSQHHRHRTWSFNEISRRYTDIDIQFFEPKKFRTQHGTNKQASNSEEIIDPLIDPMSISGGNAASYLVRAHHRKSLKLYNKLIDAGICREQARGVLPQNLYTQYYGTVDLNNMIKFIKLRIHEGAQEEIQDVAKACLAICSSLWPKSIAAVVEVEGLA